MASNVLHGNGLYAATVDTEMGNVCWLSCLHAEVG
jgi:hypothetical protein